MPYSSKTFEETYNEIMHNNVLCFKENEWLGISNDAKDLIKRMFKIDVNERLNAQEVLKHPRIKKMQNRLQKNRICSQKVKILFLYSATREEVPLPSYKPEKI